MLTLLLFVSLPTYSPQTIYLPFYLTFSLFTLMFLEWLQDFQFSATGPLNSKKYRCTPINHPNPSTSWNSTYLCAKKEGENINLKWFSEQKRFANRRCIAINQTRNSYSWKDNFLCISKEVGLRFMWSHSGSIYGKKCLRMETEQSRGWEDNYLCAGK